jgi:hypothetical protein
MCSGEMQLCKSASTISLLVVRSSHLMIISNLLQGILSDDQASSIVVTATKKNSKPDTVQFTPCGHDVLNLV